MESLEKTMGTAPMTSKRHKRRKKKKRQSAPTGKIADSKTREGTPEADLEASAGIYPSVDFGTEKLPPPARDRTSKPRERN